MQMIAFLTDQLSIRRILDHLGLSTPPQDKPPPVREILRVAVLRPIPGPALRAPGSCPVKWWSWGVRGGDARLPDPC